MEAWIGVDPGGKHTGIVAMVDGASIHATSVERVSPAAEGLVDPTYIEAVSEAIGHAFTDALEHCNYAIGEHHLAVEDIVAPNPHLGTTNPSGVIGAGIVAGAAVAWAANSVFRVHLVRPGGHGSARVPSAYPQQLHDPRGGCKEGGLRPNRCNKACVAPNGKNRHVRSAWDVARAGRLQARIERASA